MRSVGEEDRGRCIFVVELNKSGLPSAEGITVNELVDAYNWERPDNKDKSVILSENAFDEKVPDPDENTAVIPVGSIDFCNGMLARQTNSKVQTLSPIIIPPAIRRARFTKRHLAYVRANIGYQRMDDLRGKWGVDKVFVKSASQLKCNYAGFYKRDEYPPIDLRYLVSEPITMFSEWRVFVFHGEIQDVRCYLGDPWQLPSRKTVISLMGRYEKAAGKVLPPAYTLDVAVTPEGTALVEIHAFIACGFYGFEADRLLPMLSQTWLWNLRRACGEGQRVKGEQDGKISD